MLIILLITFIENFKIWNFLQIRNSCEPFHRNGCFLGNWDYNLRNKPKYNIVRGHRGDRYFQYLDRLLRFHHFCLQTKRLENVKEEIPAHQAKGGKRNRILRYRFIITGIHFYIFSRYVCGILLWWGIISLSRS